MCNVTSLTIAWWVIYIQISGQFIFITAWLVVYMQI